MCKETTKPEEKEKEEIIESREEKDSDIPTFNCQRILLTRPNFLVLETDVDE